MEHIQNSFAKLMENENFKNRYEVLKGGSNGTSACERIYRRT